RLRPPPRPVRPRPAAQRRGAQRRVEADYRRRALPHDRPALRRRLQAAVHAAGGRGAGGEGELVRSTEVASNPRVYVRSRAANLRTVFQLRAVPRAPSARSNTAFVNFALPI